MELNCKEIVRRYLVAEGYDGLYEDGCGCELDDLFPCGGDGMDVCLAGVKIPGCSEDCGEGCEWHMGAKPEVAPGGSDDEG